MIDRLMNQLIKWLIIKINLSWQMKLPWLRKKRLDYTVDKIRDGNLRIIPWCYYCSQMRYFVRDNSMPKRDEGSCYNRTGANYTVKNSSKKAAWQMKIIIIVIYYNSITDGESNCKYLLSSLSETGSLISWIKQKHIHVAIRKTLEENIFNYSGINGFKWSIEKRHWR